MFQWLLQRHFLNRLIAKPKQKNNEKKNDIPFEFRFYAIATQSRPSHTVHRDQFLR